MELKLLTMFLYSAQEYIDAMAAGEGDDWWKGAHSLKGIALGVGAGELAALDEWAEAHGDSSAPVRGNASPRHIVAPDMRVGDSILSAIADNGIDLLVMGGYGHSRLRELAFGGATKSIMQSMTCPVMTSH